MIRRVSIKTIGDNASIAITDHGKRRVTLPNSSTSGPLQRADNGPLFSADDLGCETTSLRVSQFCALLLRWQAKPVHYVADKTHERASAPPTCSRPTRSISALARSYFSPPAQTRAHATDGDSPRPL